MSSGEGLRPAVRKQQPDVEVIVGADLDQGANGTIFWVDPVEDLIGILAVTQAVTDSLTNQKPTIMGYATPR
jgi:hypothetical protein